MDRAFREHVELAFRSAIDRLDGSYAVAAVFTESDAVFATRNEGGPLVLGVDSRATYIASDIPAFREYTDQVVYVADREFVRIDPSGWQVTEESGSEIGKSVDTVEWGFREDQQERLQSLYAQGDP